MVNRISPPPTAFRKAAVACKRQALEQGLEKIIYSEKVRLSPGFLIFQIDRLVLVLESFKVKAL